MRLLQNPLVVALLALLGGVSSSVFAFLRHGPELIAMIAPPAPPPEAEPDKERGWDFWTIELENLSAELQDEKGRMKKENEEIETRRARLANELHELEKVRSEIASMRQDIDEKIIQVGVDEQKNLKTLSQTYAKLSPAAAAAILMKMDDATVVKILSLMKPDIVAPIFEQMALTAGPTGPTADRAASLTEKIRIMRSNKAGP